MIRFSLKSFHILSKALLKMSNCHDLIYRLFNVNVIANVMDIKNNPNPNFIIKIMF